MSRKISSVHVEMSADSSKLAQALKSVKSGLLGTTKDFKKFGDASKTTFTELNSAVSLAKQAFTDVVGAARKIYDLGKQGAQLELVAGKFDKLSVSIGTTSDVLMNDLRNATQGMVSDANLMKSASDFMALGLVNTREEAVRLTKVAGTLGMDMNQLVLTLTNQTTMRFDALGVSVAGFDERVQALKDTGMDANAAFNEAFLQQAEAQIAKVGDVADTTTGKFMKIESEISNVTDAMKVELTPAILGITESLAAMAKADGGLIDDLKGIIKWVERNTYVTNVLNEARDKGIITQLEYTRAGSFLFGSEEKNLEQVKKIERELETYNAMMKNRALAARSVGRAEDDAANSTSRFAQATEETKEHLLMLKDRLSLTEVKAAALAEKARENARGMERWAEGVRNTKSALDILNDFDLNIADDITAELERIEWGKLGGPALEGAKGNLERLFAEGKIDKDQLAAGLTEIGAAAITLQGEIDGLTADQVSQEMAAALKIPPEEAKAKVAELQAALDAMTTQQYIVKIIQQVSSVNVGATGQPTSGRPTGGPVFSGQSYIVGEHGPELFTPSSSGGVTANNRVGGGSPTINIYTLPGQSESAIAARVVAMLSRNSGRNRAGLGYAGA